MKNLVIFGANNDPHILRVIEKLKSFAVTPVLLDPFETAALTIKFKTKKNVETAHLRTKDDQVINFDENCVIWFRNKRFFLTNPQTKEEQVQHYMLTERWSYFQSIITLTKVKSFNSLSSITLHRKKPFQLKLARQLGLQIPDTIVSSDKAQMLDFMQHNEETIVKPLQAQNVPGNKQGDSFGVFTYKVTRDEIQAMNAQDIEAGPVIMQRYVPKRYELRIFVFDNVWHAYKIDSQHSILGATDWRWANKEDIFSATDIPTSLGAKLVEYLRISGLTYGSFDFIVDVEGSFVFLECNSDGQWAWLENPDDDDTPITATIAAKVHTMLSSSEEYRWAS